MSDPAEALRAQLLEFAKMGFGTPHASRAAIPYAEVLKTHFKNAAEALVRDAGEQPVSYSYQSDATSHLLPHRTTIDVNGAKVTRAGKHLLELLQERGVYKTLTASGSWTVAMMFREPVPLSAGKTAWNFFAAYTEFMPMLQSLGHRGPCITHIHADRAVFSALLRKARQRHAAYREMWPSDDTMAYLFDLVLGTACPLHDIQNGLKWGCAMYTKGSELRDFHITMESLRNSAALLYQHVGEFIMYNLAFDPVDYDFDEVCAFWIAMGIHVDWVERIAELNPIWREGKLYVNARVRLQKNWRDEVAIVCVCIFKWRRFSESRWCGSATAGKSLLGSLSIGLEELVRRTRDDPHCTDFHIHGFERCTVEVRKLAVVMSIVGTMVESLHLEVMEDDRCVRRVAVIEETWRQEMMWACELGNYIWDRLASVISPHQNATTLRADVLYSAHIAFAFIKDRVLNAIRGDPFGLAIGDKAANLRDLAERADTISDEATWKICQLYRVGVSVPRIEQILEVIADLHWSTKAVEEQHGSTAVVQRFTPDKRGESLVLWAFFHMLRCYSAPSPDEKQRGRIEQALAKTIRRAPRRTTGRNPFLRTLFEHRKAALGAGEVLSHQECRRLMVAHSGLFFALPLTEQERYNAEARREAIMQERILEHDAQHLDARLSLHIARLREEEEQRGCTNRIAHNRFTRDELLSMAAQVASKHFSLHNVQAAQRRAYRPPLAPHRDAQEFFETQELFEGSGGDVPRPRWLRTMCWQREEMRGVTLVTACEEGREAFLFLYARQDFLAATFLRMTYVRPTFPAYDSLSAQERLAAWRRFNLHTWEYAVGDYRRHDEIPADAVYVVEGVQLGLGRTAFANILPEDIDEWMQAYPKTTHLPAAKSESSSAGAGSSAPKHVLEEHPWVRRFFSEGVTEKKRRLRGKQHDEEHEDRHDEESSFRLGAIVEEAWDRIEASSSAMPTTSGTDAENFFVRMRHHGWTGGAAEDVTATEARKGLPRTWCKTYGVNQSFSLKTAQVGDFEAMSISLEWCSRCEHFYRIWIENNDPMYIYSDDEKASFPVSDAWETFVAGLSLDSAAHAKAMQVEQVTPGHPRAVGNS